MTRIFFLSFAVVSLLFSVSCKQDKAQTSSSGQNEAPVMLTPPVHKKNGIFFDWLKNANVYEVNVRQFTDEGTFSALLPHLPRLKKMGVDVLWLMPIYPISKTKRKGDLGSYYAVSDYKDVNPEFGNKAQFRQLVDSIHSLRMKVILDFVPNHTGWDHVWIKEHPEWFTQDGNGNIIDPIDPNTGESWGWTDVADLNFDNQEMRKEMISALEFWVDTYEVDGYRMDVAHNVPDDFWDQVSKALFAKKKDIFMLAESEVSTHRNNDNFHVTYGWSFHHLLNEIAKGEKTAADIAKWYKEDREKFSKGWHMHFTSNHDENSWNGTVFERYGDADKCMTALTFTFDGMPLIYGGQEEPLKKRLEFFEKDPIPFGNYEYEEFYRRLLQVKHMNRALWNGSYGVEPNIIVADDKLLVFEKKNGEDEVICMFNLSNEPVKYTLHRDAPMFENITAARRFEGGEGMSVYLDSWDYKILSNR